MKIYNQYKQRIILFGLLVIFEGISLKAQSPEGNDSLRTFTLGAITITATKPISDFSSIGNAALNENFTRTIPGTLQGMPGISMSAGGSKNEPMLYLRGFSLRQVPVFVDGIPVYVPYDGIFDISRIQSSGIAEIKLEKGYSSLLYGANTLGGAVNIISRKPADKMEGQFLLGSALSSEGISKSQGGVYLAGRYKKWYATGSLSYGKRNFQSIAASFDTLLLEQDHKRDNSQSEDLGYSLRIGFEPKTGHEYAISYTAIRASKGVPVYLGLNPSNKARYWQYPAWDKDCIQLHTQTRVGSKAILKTRWFYDTYFNELRSYDNNTYSTQLKNSSFTSIYDDISSGGAIELKQRIGAKHEITFGINSKYDHHSEYNLDQSPRNFSDLSSLAGIEDEWHLTKKIELFAGIAYQMRRGIEAEDYVASKDSVFSFPVSNNGKWNMQAAISYRIASQQQLWFSISNRSRFATMKDRYSYRFGTSIPNPELRSEQATHFEIKYLGQSNSFRWELSAFHSQLEDVIQRVDEVEPGKYQFQNSGKAQHQGFEAGIDYRPCSYFTLSGSYTYLSLKNISHPELLFVDIPKHSLSAQTSWHYTKHGEIYVNLLLNSKRFSSSDGAFGAGGFTLLNMGLHHDFHSKFSLQFTVRNILDKEYYYEEGYVEEGRTFTLVMGYKLGQK